MFDSFQLWFVKKLKEQNVCCCIYHVEMEELWVAFNYMRMKVGLHPLEGCFCACEYVCQGFTEGHCNANACTFTGVTAMLEAILCSKKDDSK